MGYHSFKVTNVKLMYSYKYPTLGWLQHTTQHRNDASAKGLSTIDVDVHH